MGGFTEAERYLTVITSFCCGDSSILGIPITKWINVQDLHIEVLIVHGGIIFQDRKNLIIRVKSMCVAGMG